MGLILPSGTDNSQSNPLVGVSGGEREWTEGIHHGLGGGYYPSGHGSLPIFHGSPCVLLLLADHIHFKHLWVTCSLHSTLLKNK